VLKDGGVLRQGVLACAGFERGGGEYLNSFREAWKKKVAEEFPRSTLSLMRNEGRLALRRTATAARLISQRVLNDLH
jgi:hypothetical protein